MSNIKVFALMAGMTALFGAVGGLIGGQGGMMMALVFAALMNVVMYWASAKMVLKMYGAQTVTEREAPELYRMVDRLRNRAGLPMPTVAIAPHPQPNAFATGRNPQNAAVCVTEGILELLDERELRGVLGHELAHVGVGAVEDDPVHALGMAGGVAGRRSFQRFPHIVKLDHSLMVQFRDDRGVSAGLLGLVLGMVGTSPTTAEERFTFGSLFLGDGLSLVAVALGIFGLAEIASRASQRRGQTADRGGCGLHQHGRNVDDRGDRRVGLEDVDERSELGRFPLFGLGHPHRRRPLLLAPHLHPPTRQRRENRIRLHQHAHRHGRMGRIECR